MTNDGMHGCTLLLVCEWLNEVENRLSLSVGWEPPFSIFCCCYFARIASIYQFASEAGTVSRSGIPEREQATTATAIHI